MSLRDLVLSRPKKLEKVDVHEWEGDVYVRCMNGFEHAEVARAWVSEDVGLFACLLYLYSICDENGDRVFQTMDEVKTVPAYELECFYNPALKINKMRKDDHEEIAKN